MSTKEILTKTQKQVVTVKPLCNPASSVKTTKGMLADLVIQVLADRAGCA